MSEMGGRNLLSLWYSKYTGLPYLTETGTVHKAIRRHLAVNGTELRNSVPSHKIAEDIFKNFYGKYVDKYVDKYVTCIFSCLNLFGIFP